MNDTEEVNMSVHTLPLMILTKDDVMTSAQDSVKEQLLQRALPVYTPPTEIDELFSHDQLFSCSDCGDKFVLESSLIRHIERLSVSIKYCCSSCNKTLMFYNRCQLLAHIRNHSEEHVNSNNSPTARTTPLIRRDEIVCNGDVEPDSLSLSPLPKEKYPLGPFIPLPVDECGRLIQNKDSTKKSTADAHTQVTEQNLISERIISNKTNEETAHNKTVELRKETALETNLDMDVSGVAECRECGSVSPNGDIKEHFIGTNSPVNLQFKCKICHLILPTKCSLQAHNRIHTQTRPYICPECTREFELWASFSVHLMYTCFHLAKSVHFRCIQCKNIFTTSANLEVHLLTQHVKNVYKCNTCPIACFSLEALKDHKLNIHKQSTPVTQSYQQCQLCPDRLIPKTRILFHINDHCRDPLVRVYVYQCIECNFFTQKKSDFAVHNSVCSKNDETTFSIFSPPSSFEKNNKKFEISPVHKKIIVPVNKIQNNNSLAQRKVFIPLDANQNSNLNNFVKVVYGIPQASKAMHVTLFPKNYIKTIKKVNLSKSQERTILPKFTVDQICLRENTTSALLPNTEELSTKNTGNEGSEEKKYVYMTEKRCETNAEQAECLLSSMASDSKVVKDSASLSYASIGKQSALLRLCALCKKELVAVPQRLGVSNFQALCFKCSKSHTFLKNNNKLVIVSRDKSVNSDAKNTNGKINITSQLNENKDVISRQNITNNFKKTVNIALNGPLESKKLNESTGNNVNNNSYRCHICKDLISMDWKKIQDHFSEKHPNFNLLILSPKIDKLNVSSLKVPFIVKDNKIYPKDESKMVSESCDDKIDSNDEFDNMEEDIEVKKEWDNNSDADESVENDRFLYMKRERDIPIDYDLIPSKLKKKKRSHKTAEVPSTPFSSGQILPPLEQISGDHKYQCAKCQYSEDNVESFQKHIVIHRIDKNVIQCMECGLCFVVRPSFEKHLFICHRIKDVESYMQKNNCYNDTDDNKSEELVLNDEDPEPTEEIPADLVENQCRVCREIFDTAFELSKHFRTHGMAFLLMKKRENKTL